MTWCSLRDSRRYYRSLGAKKKSGDTGGDPITTPVVNDTGAWEYSELLSFLPDVANKRRYVYKFC